MAAFSSDMKKLTLIETTEEERAIIDKAIVAIGEVCKRFDASNQSIMGDFDIRLTVKRDLNWTGWEHSKPIPEKITVAWWHAGRLTEQGYGTTLDHALHMLWARTDATSKRESAARCRAEADRLEREAKALEAEQAPVESA